MRDIANKLGKAFVFMGGVLVQVLASVGNVLYLTFDFVGEAFKTGAEWLTLKAHGLMEKGGCEKERKHRFDPK